MHHALAIARRWFAVLAGLAFVVTLRAPARDALLTCSAAVLAAVSNIVAPWARLPESLLRRSSSDSPVTLRRTDSAARR
jgi:hypothetical protein